MIPSSRGRARPPLPPMRLIPASASAARSSQSTARSLWDRTWRIPATGSGSARDRCMTAAEGVQARPDRRIAPAAPCRRRRDMAAGRSSSCGGCPNRFSKRPRSRRDLEVISSMATAPRRRHRISELLPLGFGPDNLKCRVAPFLPVRGGPRSMVEGLLRTRCQPLHHCLRPPPPGKDYVISRPSRR
jgi:hypothetical protein